MSTRRGGASRGPPKHQNSHAWKPDAGVKKKDKELGGKLHPYAAVTGVCSRCKEQILWKRKYGKYKALREPAKCNQCGKRAVRQAYHKLCADCAQQRNVCPKCCQQSGTLGGECLDREIVGDGHNDNEHDHVQHEANEIESEESEEWGDGSNENSEVSDANED